MEPEEARRALRRQVNHLGLETAEAQPPASLEHRAAAAELTEWQ